MFALGALGRLPGRAVRARLKVQIAQTAAAAFGQNRLLTIEGQIRNQRATLGIRDHRADRHSQNDVFGGCPVSIRTLAVLTTTCPVDSGVAIVNQRIDIAIRHRDDRTAAATITPARATFGNELLATKCNDAIAAVPGMDFDGGFINKFHR